MAEFSTAPRIIKPERGLLVFAEEGSNTNTSLQVTTAGENASTVHIETRGEGGLLRGRRANTVRARLIRALDQRLARADAVELPTTPPRQTSALAEKHDALQRIQTALGLRAAPGYLVDLDAADLRPAPPRRPRRRPLPDFVGELEDDSVSSDTSTSPIIR